jgi:hypothetical protein
MATMAKCARKTVIALAAGSCGLLALVNSSEADDVAPGEQYSTTGLPPFDSEAVKRKYLVTYMKSHNLENVDEPPRSATVVTVTNLTQEICHVSVEWFRGLSDTNDEPSCITDFTLEPDLTADFCSRDLPIGVTTCNSICDPELDFHEGRAIVGASCKAIGVSSRVYYAGEDDIDLLAITDSKIVDFKDGNEGD